MYLLLALFLVFICLLVYLYAEKNKTNRIVLAWKYYIQAVDDQSLSGYHLGQNRDLTSLKFNQYVQNKDYLHDHHDNLLMNKKILAYQDHFVRLCGSYYNCSVDSLSLAMLNYWRAKKDNLEEQREIHLSRVHKILSILTDQPMELMQLRFCE